MKRYFVRYAIHKYEGEMNEEFETIEEVIKLLSSFARKPDFYFDVIHGERVEFEPAEVVKAYRVKRT